MRRIVSGLLTEAAKTKLSARHECTNGSALIEVRCS